MAKEKQLNVIIDENLKREVKAQAAKEGKSISEVIRDLLAKWLGSKSEDERD